MCFSSIIVKEGHGNPLQYSCLENPVNGGADSPWGHKESERLTLHPLMTRCVKISGLVITSWPEILISEPFFFSAYAQRCADCFLWQSYNELLLVNVSIRVWYLNYLSFSHILHSQREST